MRSVVRGCGLARQIHTNRFTIQKVKPTDRKEVQRLMFEVFYKTEPSSMYAGVSEKTTISPLVQQMTLDPLDEDLSFIVKCKDEEQAAGVIINASRPTYLEPDYMHDVLETISCPKEKTLMELWKFISTVPNNPKDFFGDEERLFEFRYLAVDQRFVKRGIGDTLVRTSKKEAIEKGFKFIRIDCTSAYTARIATSMGLRCIFSLKYADYRNRRGEKVFQKVFPPHLEIRVFVGESNAVPPRAK